MFVSANALDSLKALAGINSLARRRPRNTASSVQPRVKNGLGIDVLRAVGGPPGGAKGSSGKKPGGASPLVRPPESGQGLLSQLQAQVRSASPLTGALTGVRSAGQNRAPRSLGLLQAGLVKARQDFQRLDGRIRLLQASAGSLRSVSAAFGMIPLPQASLDLVA